MQVHNTLPLLLDCLKKWKKTPEWPEFERDYLAPLIPHLKPMLEDFEGIGRSGLYDVVTGLDWPTYREETLALDARKEEQRLRKHIDQVEKLLGVGLKGEVVLFGAFTMMDGYARFDRGTHRVFLGVDESHGRGAYLDVLLTHELTHVARESKASVWEGFGLSPQMTHDEFVLSQPVIEHLFSEGFSCVVSEILNPSCEAWNYVYQTEDSLAQILTHGPAVDRVVHRELKKKKGNYRSLYDTSLFKPEMPRYAHYVWAWRWVKEVVETFGKGNVQAVLSRCSQDFMEHSLKFKLE
ncbi:MAG: hypothetical protein AB1540_16200 [Bdellovibrionota bacterium]